MQTLEKAFDIKNIKYKKKMEQIADIVDQRVFEVQKQQLESDANKVDK